MPYCYATYSRGIILVLIKRAKDRESLCANYFCTKFCANLSFLGNWACWRICSWVVNMIGSLQVNCCSQEIGCACPVKMACTVLPSLFFFFFFVFCLFFYLADTNVPNPLLNRQATLWQSIAHRCYFSMECYFTRFLKISVHKQEIYMHMYMYIRHNHCKLSCYR